MPDALSQWWLIFASILLARMLLQFGASSAYQQITSRLDARRDPDQRRMAGEWLRAWLVARDLDGTVEVVVSDGSKLGDSFWPSRRLIHLTAETFSTRDSTAWAVAAHELGHAQLRRLMGLLGPGLDACRLGFQLAAAATPLMFANLWLADAQVTALAWWILVVGLGLTVGVLIDEAIASGLALCTLREDGRVDSLGLRRAAFRLAGAYGTYVAGFAGSLLLLVEWDLIASIVEAVSLPSPTDTVSNTARGLALILLLRGIWSLAFILWPRSGQPLWVVQAMTTGLLAWLLMLVWQAPIGPNRGLLLAVGALPVTSTVLVMFGLACAAAVGMVVATGFLLWFGLFREDGSFADYVQRDRQNRQGKREEKASEVDASELSEGEATLKEAAQEHRSRPPLVSRLYELRRAAYLPLCVAVLLS